jgi:hypothetical protein
VTKAVKRDFAERHFTSVVSASLNRHARIAIKIQQMAWKVVRTIKTLDRMPHAATSSSAAANHNR